MEKPPILSDEEIKELAIKPPYTISDLKWIAQTQRDADVEWYEKEMTTVSVANLIEKAREEVAREIFKTIEKIENHHKPKFKGAKYAICNYNGFEDCRKKILSLKDKYNKQSIGR